MCFLRSTLLKPSAVQAQLSLKKVPDGFLRPGRLQIIHLSWVRAIPMVSIVMLLRFYSAMRESSLVWTLMMLLWWSFPIFSPLEMNTPFFDLERHSVVGQLSIFRSFIDHMLDLPRFLRVSSSLRLRCEFIMEVWAVKVTWTLIPSPLLIIRHILRRYLIQMHITHEPNIYHIDSFTAERTSYANLRLRPSSCLLGSLVS